ncbi:MAG: site-specific DNA-methyltransferase [Moraxellaceae bacterium]
MTQISLLSGDCLESMLRLKDQSIDLILCDLPYGTTQCAWDSIIPLDRLWEQYSRLIKPRGVIALTAMQPFTSLLVASNLQMFRYEWIWEKGNASGFLNANKQPLRAHESVLIFYKEQPTYNPQMVHDQPRRTTKRKTVNSECYGKAISLTEYDSTTRHPRSVQFFSSDKQKASYHPTQKPVALMQYLIETYTNEGDWVLDSCMGSGTTGVACVNTGRNFIGIEKEPQYLEVATSRINEAVELLSFDLFGSASA